MVNNDINNLIDVMSKPKTKDIQEYAKYLLKEFDHDKGRYYVELNSFSERGTINGILYENTAQEMKVRFLEWYREPIGQWIGKRVLTFKEFMNQND